MIDSPIIDIVNGFNSLPFCFTLQSCYGHFVHQDQRDPHNIEPLPAIDTIGKVEYRMAYIAFCIENSRFGRDLLDDFQRIPDIDPQNIQFCCAEWFWKRQVNSYILQVEPDRFKRKDKAILDPEEAMRIEVVRNQFFTGLNELLAKIKERFHDQTHRFTL